MGILGQELAAKAKAFRRHSQHPQPEKDFTDGDDM
jgi:hypothetical protein